MTKPAQSALTDVQTILIVIQRAAHAGIAMTRVAATMASLVLLQRFFLHILRR